MHQMGAEVSNSHKLKGCNVLARAWHAKHPGVVFARAAAAGEVDPLADVDGRLLVGLEIKVGK